MRVTSGIAKGKKLKAPNIPGFRPSRDVYKQAVFGILGDKVLNSTCLDLYAGSGGLGIEALSRGADFCYFVDNNKTVIEVVKENLNTTGLHEKSEVIQQDAVKYATNASRNYDIVFVDPFFMDTSHKFLIQNLEEILKENGAIVFSHAKELDINDLIKNTRLKIYTQRNYGKAYLTILTNKV